MAKNERFEILDCRIDRATMADAVARVADEVASCNGGYICFANVHTVVSARDDLRLRQINNQSLLSLADGKPLTVVAKLSGIENAKRVAGPDFMLQMLDQHRHLRHFFYGSTDHTLSALRSKLTTLFPDLNIAGTYAPPFRELSKEESQKVTALIKSANPDLVWVGLGAPKQEYWMADHWQQLRPAVLLGVGAAFDFHAGIKGRAPQWMQKFGLEWLHRLCNEPGRLWKRYIFTNTRFAFYALTRSLIQRK